MIRSATFAYCLLLLTVSSIFSSLLSLSLSATAASRPGRRHHPRTVTFRTTTNTTTTTAVRFGRVPKREKAKILAAMQKVNQNSQEKQLTEQLEDEGRLLINIVQAHEETCDYTKEKVASFIEKARRQPVYARCPMQMVRV